MDFNKKRLWGPTPKYSGVLNYKRPNNDFIVVAGPCSVESKDQIYKLAGQVKASGATHLRGGVFRAGTYPGDNFGYVDMDLIKAHHHAAEKNGLKNIIEILDYTPESISAVLPYADCVQVGARQMQNYTLLKTLGSTGKTIFLKRNTGATLDEWLGSAEWLLSAGDCHPVLIERGSSTFENHTRWSLSVSMIAGVKALCDVPVIVDASHASGRRDLVEPLTLAGVAAGSNGLLIEVHGDPDKSFSDPDQAVEPIQFETIMKRVQDVRRAINVK